MNTKKELARFFTWLRNGICFAFTWFVILRLIASWVIGAETVSVAQLTDMLLWTGGGVLLFCIAFTRLIIRKAGFTARLTFFMVLFTIYEIGYFYYTGLFRDFGCIYEWALFALAVVPLYFICLAIYSVYRKKKGALYTSALQKYQQERRTAND